MRCGIPIRTISEAMTGGTHVGTPCSDEIKQRFSRERKGVASKAVWSDEAREKASERLRGERHFAYGKPSPLRAPDWSADQTENRIKIYFRSRYGVEVGDRYVALRDHQAGLCAICGKPETQKQRGKVIRLSLDHNHETGQIRELLCHNCNLVVGHAKESVKILQAAIDYLKKHDEP
jgi:hypothetical protein